MKIFDALKSSAVIRTTADRFGGSTENIRREIQAAIDAAWNTDDQAARDHQRALFPVGKPTPEQFISTTAKHLKRRSR